MEPQTNPRTHRIESLRALYPGLTDDQLEEADENLTRYIMIVYRYVKSMDAGPPRSVDGIGTGPLS